VNFSNDGRKFVSVGYDKKMRLWDTETGAVLRTIDNGRMFYTGVLHPDDDKQVRRCAPT
jgi:pre-mRNA-processing factor 17